ncbi:hypothetical protein GA0070609_4426 [Micromonospora echinaurantiaca]|uniref:Uncharacterized protein n=1 Tax=Micromonospora echinaurantiaca TaxID=47857 RepID=A0A1C5JG75_9ACTN|nr:hypothetical protein [Micromonospora echinaurantiaca]SCG69562.1 hypothetical protein GA0070609_4426 [Micromonospora echinaurantiaca]
MIPTDAERIRRWQQGLCGWCAEPLPEDRAYVREFCGDRCRQANHRAMKRAGLR